MYRIRIPLAILMLSIIGGILYLDKYTKTHYATSILMGVFILGALWEFLSLIKNRGYRPYCKMLMIGVLVGIALQILSDKLIVDLYKLALVMFLLICGIKDKEENAIENTAVNLFGIVYVWIFLSYLLNIRLLSSYKNVSNQDGIIYLLVLFIVAKSMDMGGYLLGKPFGKHKICPSISPKKSWEGTLGGFALCIGVMFLMRYCFPVIKDTFSWQISIIFALAIGTLSLIGDLSESLLKRRCDVKDSSSLIPEFGGFLDMIDSLIFVAPVGYYIIFFQIFGLGQSL